MKQTDNYKLALYEKDDKLIITADEDSLNSNTKKIDEVLNDKAYKTEVDGQWVAVGGDESVIFMDQIFSTAGLYEYDISAILPQDNYNYECAFTCFGRTSNVNGNSVGLGIKSNIFKPHLRFGRAQTRSNQSFSFAGSAVIPVGTDRIVIFDVHDLTGSSGSCGLFLRGYRRLRTNI